MNEYTCACGEPIMRQTIMAMLDAVALHMQDCPEGAKEAATDQLTSPARRPYPTRAIYRGTEPCFVMGYAGAGEFIIRRGEHMTTVHRRHLTFTRQ